MSTGRRRKDSIENPLRAGLAIEKVPEPCLIVVFGATGDLTSRKILPAIYNLRRAGLLPAETSVVGFSRRPLTDEDFRKRDARRRSRRTRASRSRTACGTTSPRASSTSRQFADRGRVSARSPSGSSRSTPRAARAATSSSTSPRRRQRTRRSSPTWAAPACSRQGDDGEGWARIVVEKPFGHDLDSARRAQRLAHPGLRRVAGLPHRPLPGQGDRPQPDGLPLRQRHLRAALEPALRRPRADHRGRGPGRRGPRRVLRAGRRQPRHPAEPPAAAAHPGRHGAADRLRGRRAARREGARAARHRHRRGRCAGARATSCAAQYAAGWVGDKHVVGYRQEPEVAPDLEDRDLRGAQARDPELALGRRAVLPAHRQAPGPRGRRRSRSSSSCRR